MTVAELINELQKLDQDKEALLEDEDGLFDIKKIVKQTYGTNECYKISPYARYEYDS